MDLDTFLVALYTIVDDLYQGHTAPLLPKRRGAKPRLSDSEALTLALCAQWHGTSERAFLRYAAQHWRGYFPALTTQSACNRRFRNLAGALLVPVPSGGLATGGIRRSLAGGGHCAGATDAPLPGAEAPTLWRRGRHRRGRL